ncbi:MAG: hypothetical protein R3C68_11095 [Myxococcota bacterium]
MGETKATTPAPISYADFQRENPLPAGSKSDAPSSPTSKKPSSTSSLPPVEVEDAANVDLIEPAPGKPSGTAAASVSPALIAINQLKPLEAGTVARPGWKGHADIKAPSPSGDDYFLDHTQEQRNKIEAATKEKSRQWAAQLGLAAESFDDKSTARRNRMLGELFDLLDVPKPDFEQVDIGLRNLMKNWPNREVLEAFDDYVLGRNGFEAHPIPELERWVEGRNGVDTANENKKVHSLVKLLYAKLSPSQFSMAMVRVRNPQGDYQLIDLLVGAANNMFSYASWATADDTYKHLLYEIEPEQLQLIESWLHTYYPGGGINNDLILKEGVARVPPPGVRPLDELTRAEFTTDDNMFFNALENRWLVAVPHIRRLVSSEIHGAQAWDPKGNIPYAYRHAFMIAELEGEALLRHIDEMAAWLTPHTYRELATAFDNLRHKGLLPNAPVRMATRCNGV